MDDDWVYPYFRKPPYMENIRESTLNIFRPTNRKQHADKYQNIVH